MLKRSMGGKSKRWMMAGCPKGMRDMLSVETEIPNPKLQAPNKFQTSNFKIQTLLDANLFARNRIRLPNSITRAPASSLQKWSSLQSARITDCRKSEIRNPKFQTNPKFEIQMI